MGVQQAPGLCRTDLQRQDLSVPGRKRVQVTGAAAMPSATASTANAPPAPPSPAACNRPGGINAVAFVTLSAYPGYATGKDFHRETQVSRQARRTACLHAAVLAACVLPGQQWDGHPGGFWVSQEGTGQKPPPPETRKGRFLVGAGVADGYAAGLQNR
jgi:hypothetical protein